MQTIEEKLKTIIGDLVFQIAIKDTELDKLREAQKILEEKLAAYEMIELNRTAGTKREPTDDEYVLQQLEKMRGIGK